MNTRYDLQSERALEDLVTCYEREMDELADAGLPRMTFEDWNNQPATIPAPPPSVEMADDDICF